jgi:hypothetical protein
MPSFATSRTTTATQTHRSTACRVSELKIIQEQVGHEHASTTSLYTCVSSDFRTRTLRRHLDSTITAALQTQTGRQA